ncbi:MAG: succinate dehydrogenase cytochrome b subunit [Acidimicrobiia bacterium]|nr:succinate dehydrogenase cytochrome b subunit [Acidimicrobiia bacterium]
MTATDSKTDSAEKARRPLPWPIRFYRSDVGKKYVMAITGIVGLGFIVFHMLGNLHAFEGSHQLNEYAEGLREIGEPIAPRTMLVWIGRIGLLTALLLHVHSAFTLSRSNKAARGPVPYENDRNYLAANYASRTMGWTGVIVLLFLVWHLADLTIGIELANPDFSRGEVYANLIASLERWPVFLLYLAAQGALALHIWHGAWSLFQSIGVNNPRFNHWRSNFATGLATIVAFGYLTVPFSIMFGIIH